MASALKVRKRADTKTLLGSAYKDVVNDENVPPPPQPLKDVHAYKDKGLKAGNDDKGLRLAQVRDI